MKTILFSCLLIFLVAACDSTEEESTEASAPVVPSIKYEEKDYFLHDTSLFTEGLLMHEGQLFESTGSPDAGRKSLIGINDLQTGKFIKKVELADKTIFGEGIVFFRDKLYQLTYKNQLGFIYDAASYKQTGQFKYSNKEGWGLTTDGSYIIMSDGTDSLTYLNPADMQPVKKLAVKEGNARRDSLNELEYIKGYIYANIWLTNNIVKINPADGKVVGKLDLSPLAFKAALTQPGIDALNGIAYDSTKDLLYVTGKFYSRIYQIKLSE